jgi:hypothetical protein
MTACHAAVPQFAPTLRMATVGSAALYLEFKGGREVERLAPLMGANREEVYDVAVGKDENMPFGNRVQVLRAPAPVLRPQREIWRGAIRLYPGKKRSS